MKQRYIIAFVSISLLIFVALSFANLYEKNFATRAFRSGDEKIVMKRLTKPDCLMNLFKVEESLQAIRVFGSGYFDFHDLDDLVRDYHIPKNQFYIVDLTHEQTLYVNHHTLEWYGYEMIDGGLKPLYKHSASRSFIFKLKAWLYERETGHSIVEIKPQDLKSEKQLVEERGYQYMQPLNYDWLSDWSFVDRFMPIFEKIPEDAWVYFHCAHGHGRTTTLMLLYDIYRADRTIPLKTILNRQYCLGGEDVKDTVVWKSGTWNEGELKAREKIIYFFYDYMHDPEGYPKNSFMTWKAKQNLHAPST